MPIYEFSCNACGALTSVFTRSINAPLEARCDRCGSTDIRRLVSRVAVLRGTPESSLEDMDNLDPNDPQAMAAWARQMQREMGDDAGPEMEEMIQRLERGETLDDDFDHADDDYGD